MQLEQQLYLRLLKLIWHWHPLGQRLQHLLLVVRPQALVLQLHCWLGPLRRKLLEHWRAQDWLNLHLPVQ